MEKNEKKDVRDEQQTVQGLTRRTLLKGAAALGALTAGGMALNMAAPGAAEAVERPLPKKWDDTCASFGSPSTNG